MTTQNSAMGDEELREYILDMFKMVWRDALMANDKNVVCTSATSMVMRKIKDNYESRDQQIALAAQEYQTHIRYIRTLSNGKEVWGIRIAYEGKQIYGDIANSEQEAKAKLDAELSALKQAQNKEK